MGRSLREGEVPRSQAWVERGQAEAQGAQGCGGARGKPGRRAGGKGEPWSSSRGKDDGGDFEQLWIAHSVFLKSRQAEGFLGEW